MPEDENVDNRSSLSLDALRRVQATLRKKGEQRDPKNFRAVGFAPGNAAAASLGELQTVPITAQFDVRQKLPQISDNQRFGPSESVRLLERSTRHYQRLNLTTDVVQTGDVVATGVRVFAGSELTGSETATVSVVVRWTKIDPPPPFPAEHEPQDPRWRWGVLSVAHLLAGKQPFGPAVRIERRQTCGSGPATIEGRILTRGRVPGGPDLCLIETGLDRLWLSGFLTRQNAPVIQPAQESHLLSWISGGTTGDFLGDGVTYGWTWRTFYPELTIERLGNLQQIVRYEINPEHTLQAPLGPGSSGGVLVAGGIPIGLHIASVRPDYRIGFAQTFAASLSWLSKQIRASHVAIVALLTNQ